LISRRPPKIWPTSFVFLCPSPFPQWRVPPLRLPCLPRGKAFSSRGDNQSPQAHPPLSRLTLRLFTPPDVGILFRSDSPCGPCTFRDPSTWPLEFFGVSSFGLCVFFVFFVLVVGWGWSFGWGVFFWVGCFFFFFFFFFLWLLCFFLKPLATTQVAHVGLPPLFPLRIDTGVCLLANPFFRLCFPFPLESPP